MRKLLIFVSVVIGILILTNPSPTAFKNYFPGDIFVDDKYVLIMREYNFFACSVYEARWYNGEAKTSQAYFAIAGNFFPIGNRKWMR